MEIDKDPIQLESQPAPARDEAPEPPDPSKARPSENDPAKTPSDRQPQAIASPPTPPEGANTNAPTSSLGGSARELLNANGTQR